MCTWPWIDLVMKTPLGLRTNIPRSQREITGSITFET
jgi:hypothetical protein